MCLDFFLLAAWGVVGPWMGGHDGAGSGGSDTGGSDTGGLFGRRDGRTDGKSDSTGDTVGVCAKGHRSTGGDDSPF
jgi:hypothetical protein